MQKLQLLDLLPQLFDCIVTTPEIVDEYGGKLPEWLLVQSVNDTSLQKKLSTIVDPGEASAIALASEIQCEFLITDDKAARKCAEERGITVKGSAGVLSYAKKQGVIALLKPYLEQMQKTNFRISQNLIDKLLLDVGE